MAEPHGRAPQLGSPRGSAAGLCLGLLGARPLVFGSILEAPKSYRPHSLPVANPFSTRTQRSLFRWIPRSFDHPNMAKRRGMSSKGADWGPCRGSPAAGGRLADPPTSWTGGLGHGRAPWPSSPVGEPPGLGCGALPWSFGCASFGFRVNSRSTEVVSTPFPTRCESILDTDATVLVSLDSEVV